MLRDNVRQLVKHTSIYSIGWFASAVAGVLLMPVYTRYLSKAEYGAVDLIQQTNGVFRILLVSAFTYSVGRFFHNSKNEEEQRQVISTSATSVIAIALAVGALCIWFREPLARVILGDTKHSTLTGVGGMLLFFDLAFLALTFQYIVQKRSLSFVYLNLTKLVTGITANLLLVVYFRMGALGMLCGNMAAYFVPGVAAFVTCVRANGFRVYPSVLGRMFRFGLPMVPATLLATIMHNGDRLLLRPMTSLEQVGLLMIGLQFPAMLNSLLLTSFNYVWGGATIFQLAKQPDGDYQVGRIATLYMTVFVVLQATLGICAGTLLFVLAAPEYYESRHVVGLVCFGYSFHALYTFFTVKAFTHGKLTRMIFAYGAAVAVKLTLTFMFVPTYGYVASATIMTVTYLVFAVSCYLLFRRINTARFETVRLAALFGICMLGVLAAHLLEGPSPLVNAVTQTVVVLLLAAFFWFGPYFRADEKLAMRTELSAALTALRRRQSRSSEVVNAINAD